MAKPTGQTCSGISAWEASQLGQIPSFFPPLGSPHPILTGAAPSRGLQPPQIHHTAFPGSFQNGSINN